MPYSCYYMKAIINKSNRLVGGFCWDNFFSLAVLMPTEASKNLSQFYCIVFELDKLYKLY